MHSQEREGEPQKASPKKGVPTYEFDCQSSPAAFVPHEEKVLWATKKLPYGTPLLISDITSYSIVVIDL